jgi:phosphoribosylformylglycinamidine (FGAM) synthase-like enzyme
VLTRSFRAAGDEIVLLGEGFGELGGSEYLKTIHGVIQGVPPRLDLGMSAPSSDCWARPRRTGCCSRRTIVPTAASR